MRAQLKDAHCRVTELDKAIGELNGETGSDDRKQADVLIELARSADLFHTPDTTGFADLEIDGHRETWPIKSKGFRSWLLRRYYKEMLSAPSSEALNHGDSRTGTPT